MGRCAADVCYWQHPHQQLCVRGHDTFSCGRTAKGGCRECKRSYQRVSGMSPERLEAERARNRVSSMTSARLAGKRRRDGDGRTARRGVDPDYRRRGNEAQILWSNTEAGRESYRRRVRRDRRARMARKAEMIEQLEALVASWSKPTPLEVPF